MPGMETVNNNNKGGWVSRVSEGQCRERRQGEGWGVICQASWEGRASTFLGAGGKSLEGLSPPGIGNLRASCQFGETMGGQGVGGDKWPVRDTVDRLCQEDRLRGPLGYLGQGEESRTTPGLLARAAGT